MCRHTYSSYKMIKHIITGRMMMSKSAFYMQHIFFPISPCFSPELVKPLQTLWQSQWRCVFSWGQCLALGVLMRTADWWTETLYYRTYLLTTDLFSVIVSMFVFPIILSGRHIEIQMKHSCVTLCYYDKFCSEQERWKQIGGAAVLFMWSGDCWTLLDHMRPIWILLDPARPLLELCQV